MIFYKFHNLVYLTNFCKVYFPRPWVFVRMELWKVTECLLVILGKFSTQMELEACGLYVFLDIMHAVDIIYHCWMLSVIDQSMV